MGLDQWAFAISKRSLGKNDCDFDLSDRVKREELVTWRNHWGLCTWMTNLYYKKGGKKGPKKLCCICLRLQQRDLDLLERAVKKGKLYGYKLTCPRSGRPEGSPDIEFDGYCLASDQEFLIKARQAIGAGKAVIYLEYW